MNGDGSELPKSAVSYRSCGLDARTFPYCGTRVARGVRRCGRWGPHRMRDNACDLQRDLSAQSMVLISRAMLLGEHRRDKIAEYWI